MVVNSSSSAAGGDSSSNSLSLCGKSSNTSTAISSASEGEN
jgi:hypothetical protein